LLLDGIEQNNTIAFNLAMHPQPMPNKTFLLPSDVNPAVFWITNPSNRFIGTSLSFDYAFALSSSCCSHDVTLALR